MPPRLARAWTRGELGLEAPLVEVQVQLSAGLPGFTVVGMPAPVVRESRERVRAAILSAGYVFPPGRITVNLAPVELDKRGGRYDLPIALALLQASGQLQPGSATVVECYGELGLNGELRPVAGLLLASLQARTAGHRLLVPEQNAAEAALAAHPAACCAPDLRAAALRMAAPATDPHWRCPQASLPVASAEYEAGRGLQEIAGHWQVKRALLVAAAGDHNVLLVGPPGSGKSLLAAGLPTLLPPLSPPEALEVAGIAALAGLRFDPQRWLQRPYRAPHHSASAAAVIGGGAPIRPGEISLAHGGVLFLDELAEFDRRVLECLREPLETGRVTVTRARGRLELPARVQLVAAMNPCPCGYRGDPRQPRHCSPARVDRYRARISGPLLDRIDIRMEVPRLDPGELLAADLRPACAPEPTAAQAQAARERRIARSGAPSARLAGPELRGCCALEPAAQRLLQRSCSRLAVSGRAVYRLLSLSRTIADLAQSDAILAPHVAEAVQLRRALPC